VSQLTNQFGSIDIYLFDQLLRGRIQPPMRVVDAGCGSGRNLVYLLQSGFDVFAADEDPASIGEVRRLAGPLDPSPFGDRFRTEPVERLSFPDAFADVVISSAVLHFARD
jgi:SAM-dependent methyltransferase